MGGALQPLQSPMAPGKNRSGWQRLEHQRMLELFRPGLRCVLPPSAGCPDTNQNQGSGCRPGSPQQIWLQWSFGAGTCSTPGWLARQYPNPEGWREPSACRGDRCKRDSWEETDQLQRFG